MERKDFAVLMTGIKAAYPASKILEDMPSMNFWFEMLRDLDYRVAENAVKEYICTNVFPPSIADIRKLCTERMQKTGQLPDFDEAWGIVLHSVSSFGHNQPDKAYAYMDQLTENSIISDICRNLGWTAICMSDNPEATRANFRKAYEIKIERKKTEIQIPESVRSEKAALIERLVNQTAGAISTKET